MGGTQQGRNGISGTSDVCRIFGNHFATLTKFYRLPKTKDVWITSVNEVAERWNKLLDMQMQVSENQNEVLLYFDLPGQEIEAFSLQLPVQPQKVITTSHIHLNKKRGKHI